MSSAEGGITNNNEIRLRREREKGRERGEIHIISRILVGRTKSFLCWKSMSYSFPRRASNCYRRLPLVGERRERKRLLFPPVFSLSFFFSSSLFSPFSRGTARETENFCHLFQLRFFFCLFIFRKRKRRGVSECV